MSSSVILDPEWERWRSRGAAALGQAGPGCARLRQAGPGWNAALAEVDRGRSGHGQRYPRVAEVAIQGEDDHGDEAREYDREPSEAGEVHTRILAVGGDGCPVLPVGHRGPRCTEGDGCPQIARIWCYRGSPRARLSRECGWFKGRRDPESSADRVSFEDSYNLEGGSK